MQLERITRRHDHLKHGVLVALVELPANVFFIYIFINITFLALQQLLGQDTHRLSPISTYSKVQVK